LEFTFEGGTINDMAFLILGGEYMWESRAEEPFYVQDNDLYIDFETGITHLYVTFTGGACKFIVYVPYKYLVKGYTVQLTCDGDTYYYKDFSVKNSDDLLSEMGVSRLPASAPADTANHTVKIESNEILTDLYVQVYADGALLELSPGCGFTGFIRKGWSKTIQFPAVCRGDGMTTTYVTAVCAEPEKRLVFDGGVVRESEEGEYILIDEQKVTYFEGSLFGALAQYLDITFVQYDRSGRPLPVHGSAFAGAEGGSTRVRAYYDGAGRIAKWVESNGLLYYVIPKNMNPDGTYAVKCAYNFSMKIDHPENVENGNVFFNLNMGVGSTRYMLLKYNKETGTFDGTLELEPGVYSPDTLVEKFSYTFRVLPDGEKKIGVEENGDRLVSALDGSYANITELLDTAEALREEYPETDITALTSILAMTDSLDTEAKNGITVAAQQSNEYHAAVDDFLSSLTDYAENSALFGNNGALKDLGQVYAASDFITGARHVSYTQTFLSENGFVPQTTEGLGTVYVRYYNGVMLVYFPAEEMEIELTCDFGFDMPIGNTFTPAAAALNLKNDDLRGDWFGHHYTDYWEELDENTVEYNVVTEAATKVEELFEYVRGYGSLVLTFLDQIVDVGYKYLEYQQQIEYAQNKVNELDKIMFDIEAEEQLDAFFGTHGGGADKMKEYLGTVFEKIDLNTEQLNRLESLSAKLKNHIADLKARQEELKAITKGGGQAAKKLATLTKLAHSALNAVDKVLNLPVVSVAFLIYDTISGAFDVCDALVTFAGQIQNNLDEVRMAWQARQGDVSEDCKDECEDLRKWLGRYRMVYAAQFAVTCEQLVLTLVGDIGSAIGLLAGTAGAVYAVSSFAWGSLCEAGAALSEVIVYKMVEYCWDCVADECGKHKGKDDDDDLKHSKYIDPSGFIYEAVASNRIEGAVVTAYYKDDNGDPALWDASEFEQINPIVTGENGVFDWMTPTGDWLVTATKSGYYMATSSGDPAAVDGWLPVPPPQMEVYIAMTSQALPEVESVSFSGKEIRVLFTQYMDIAALENNASLVTVTKNGASVPVEFEFIDREVSPKNEEVYYGRTLYITPAAGYDFDGEITLTVSESFLNYAGKAFAASYVSGALDITQIPASIEHSYPNKLVSDVGDELSITVRLLDTKGKPIANREVSVSSLFGLYSMPASAVTDVNGRAAFAATAFSTGDDVLTFTCEDAAAELNVGVNALGTDKPKKPTANIGDFQSVASGTQLIISCETEGAVIRYTLDDTCPCEDAALYYDGPITITHNTYIRIASWTETGGYGERLNLHIICSDAVSTFNGDANEDGVVDTEDVTEMLVGILYGSGADEPDWDINGDFVVDAADALYLMTAGMFTDPMKTPAFFAAASYDAAGRQTGVTYVDLSHNASASALEFLKTAENVKFFFLDSEHSPVTQAFAFEPVI
ncbi:MAG: chitobiase/beta-hexosaminidase C-terminal domain-containing protein, partial [Clostridia bacterium]|nr:chitobiase/beta-hexosaminidase C-terminal domain-containing protein [Clostridia bacterium]